MNTKKTILNGMLFASFMLNQVNSMSLAKRVFGVFTFKRSLAMATVGGIGYKGYQFINSDYYNEKSQGALNSKLYGEMKEAHKQFKISNELQNKIYLITNNYDNLNMTLRLKMFGYSEIIKLN